MSQQLALLEALGGTAPDPQPGSSVEFYTPRWFWDPLAELFRFALDVCATRESAKCARYYDYLADGLLQPWDAVWWCNPPYNDIEAWVRCAVKAVAAGFPGVMLLPAWTDRAWWQELIEPVRDLPAATYRALDWWVETRFYRRFSFGIPGDPEGVTEAAHETSPRIYPVAVAFIPALVDSSYFRADTPDSLVGLLRQHQPVFPARAR